MIDQKLRWVYDDKKYDFKSIWWFQPPNIPKVWEIKICDWLQIVGCNKPASFWKITMSYIAYAFVNTKKKMKNINLFFDVTLCDVRVYLVTRLRVINSRLEHSVASILFSKLFGCSKKNRFYSSNLHLPKATIWSFYGGLNQFWRLTCISHFSYSFITPL